MLSHCGIADDSGSQTTLVCSNQQCSGPLYKGVRLSVSNKAEPPTETGPANKCLPGGKKRKPALTYATGLIWQCIYFFWVSPSFIRSNSITSVILKHHERWKRIPSCFPGFLSLLQCCTCKYLITCLFHLLGVWILCKWHHVLFICL